MINTRATISCFWNRPRKGHAWIQCHEVIDGLAIDPHSQLVLIPQGIQAAHKEFRLEPSYDVFHKVNSGLFREFAALQPSQDEIRAFADRYGPLALHHLFIPLDVDPKSLRKPTKKWLLEFVRTRLQRRSTIQSMRSTDSWNELGAVSGDSFDYWIENIDGMRRLISLWEAIRENDHAFIKQHLRIRHEVPGCVSLSYPKEDGTADWSIAWESSIKNSVDHHDGARRLLGELLRRELSDCIEATFGLDPSMSGERFLLKPRTLRDAMWLQFAMAVYGNTQFGICGVCGKRFEISSQGFRKNRTLCSAACKLKAHRLRQARALEMSKKGQSAQQIAKLLGSQLSTVQGWLNAGTSNGKKTPRKR